MGNPKRLRRKDPVRKAPIRNVSTYFRESNSWKEHEAQRTHTVQEEPVPTEGLDDVVSRSVNLGYEVIGKYLRQGKHEAEKKSPNGSQPGSSKDNDFEKLLSNMGRLYKDMSGFMGEVFDVFSRNPEITSALREGLGINGIDNSPGKNSKPNPADNGKGLQMKMEIASKRPAKVSLDVWSLSAESALHVPELKGGPGLPSLTDIAFRFDRTDGPVLFLKIPDTQPAGTYTGAVVEKGTNEPRGLLSVRLGP